ncbi:MAG: proton-conducting transporter membrane subunit [Desulfobacterales bacterium]|nr:proton-conducting transporter membrane subunit [Desulfobacterales bacterium]
MLIDHLVILPVMLPFIGGISALLLKRYPRVQRLWALGFMVATLVGAVSLFMFVWRSGQPLVLQIGAWPAPFGITLMADLLSAFFVLMSHLVLAMGVLYAIGSKDSCVRYPTFYPIFLLLATGLSGAFLTGDIFNLFVFVEVLALSSTVLTSISDDRFGTEAAYKYLYMSQIAAFFLLLAIGALYVSCGTLNMAQLASAIASDPQKSLIPIAIAFLMAFFMIKSATFPFHFWQPDFHTAAPTAVSAMLSSVVVKLGVYGFIRMTTLLFVDHAEIIQQILIVAGVCGIGFGGISAIGTHNVKRMLAYSTLAQVGFILVGIGWATPLSYTAALVFAFNHSIAKSAMLMLAGYIASRAAIKSAAFDVVIGVGKSLPLAGGLFLIGSLGLAGIPPTNGFISKMLVFRSGLAADQLWALLLIGLASVFTLVYTLRAFMLIWWHVPSQGVTAKPTGDKIYAPLLLVTMVLVLGLFADPLVAVSQASARWIADPVLYIKAVLGG